MEGGLGNILLCLHMCLPMLRINLTLLFSTHYYFWAILYLFYMYKTYFPLLIYVSSFFSFSFSLSPSLFLSFPFLFLFLSILLFLSFSFSFFLFFFHFLSYSSFFHPLPFFLYLSLSFSISPSLSLHVPLPFFLSLSLFLSFSPSPSLSFPLPLSVSLSPTLPLSFALFRYGSQESLMKASSCTYGLPGTVYREGSQNVHRSAHLNLSAHAHSSSVIQTRLSNFLLSKVLPCWGGTNRL